MIRDAYLDVQLRLHLPAGLVLVESARQGIAAGDAPQQPVHIVTAYNPHGREANETDNRRAQRRLVEHLVATNASYHPAAGADPSWLHVEPSVAVIGLTRQEAVDLGRRFEQDAVFEWTAEALTVVSSTDDSAVTLGWRQITPDARAIGADRAWRELGLASPYVPIAVASTALDRALDAADDERAVMLNDVYIHLAADYYAPRVEADRRRDAQSKERQLEADRAAAVARRESEERREHRRAHQAEARRRNAARHQEHVAAGWPHAWRPAHVEKWLELGGDLADAHRWSEAGWAASDVLDAAAAVGSATALPRHVRQPDELAWWEDTLSDIALGAWPAAPAAAQVSSKRLFPDGRRERWFVLPHSESGVIVERWDRSAPKRPGPHEWKSTRVAAFSSASDALAGVRELSTVIPDVLTELGTGRGTSLDLLEHLRVPRVGVDPHTHAPRIDEAAVEGGGLDLGEVASVVEGLPSRLVHCTVDGVPVVAVKTARGWQWLKISDHDLEAGALIGETVLEYRWFSESGGPPISWDGGGSIEVVAPGLAVVRQWGDLGDGREFVTWPKTPSGRADTIARWIAESDLETVAALELEPWPSSEQWLVWYDVSISLGLDIDEETIEALRRRLARMPDYVTASQAVRHPRSGPGRALAAALEHASESGFTGDLYRLQWLPDENAGR